MRCEKCREETFLPFQCPYCGGRFCAAHRLPESHDCPKMELVNAPKEAVVIQKPSSYEYKVTFGSSRRFKGRIYFSPKELKHLTIAALLVIFIGLMSGVYSSIFPQTSLPVSIATFTIILTASFFMHEIAHKVTAQKRGLWAEFRLTRWGAIITLISAISPLFKIISPGAVMISGPAGRKEIAKISIAGPITNIALATALLGAAFAPSPFSFAVFYGAFFNAFIALFNLIPIGVLDGLKIFVTIAFHKDYSEYSEFMTDIREFPNVSIDETRSFLIDLFDKNQFQPLSFYHLAGYLARTKENSQTRARRTTRQTSVATDTTN